MTTTHLTEMAEFFPVTTRAQPQPQTARLVPARFWRPGDTHEQAIARQDASIQKLKAKIASKTGAAA